VAGHRRGGRLGRVRPVLAVRERRRPQRGGVGVEPEDDAAATLLDERREPVGEVLGA
jgi:hypothetical protein